MESYKAKIITAEFDEKKDLLIWTLKNLETEKEQTYAWACRDYLMNVISVKVKEDAPIDIAPQALHDHCKDMINKEITFEVHGNPKIEPKVSEEKAAEADKIMEDAYKHLNDFCDDVLDVKKRIEEGDID